MLAPKAVDATVRTRAAPHQGRAKRVATRGNTGVAARGALRMAHLVPTFIHHRMFPLRRNVVTVPQHARQLDVVDLSKVKAALQRRMQLMAEQLYMRKTFVIVNGKGGVGKSSLSAAIAVALSKLGLRVLLMEMDEQGNNCEDLCITGTVLDDGGQAQAAAILDGKPLVPTGEARPNLWVIPGGSALEAVVEELYCQRRLARHSDSPQDQLAWMGMYAAALDQIRDDFDVIILDVAPGSEPLQLQALVAGDMIVVPSKSDPSSRKGLRTVASRYAKARSLNPMLRLLGVVVFATNSTATRVQATIKRHLVADLNGAARVFDQVIRHVESAAVACRTQGKAPQEMVSDPDLDPAQRASMRALAGDYQSLAMEVLQAKTDLDSEGHHAA
ncbi:ParA family protein [Streptomyces sp. NPDC017964]|uniref:ParA family protein n=1 Tax=Streptomyces sp. NPDC017964 TaxID=3365022 RepID=UPI0037AB4EF0